MRSSMVAPPSAVAALQSLHTLPDHTSPSTSNTRRTPRRALAEHLAEHSPNTSAPARRAAWPRARLYVAGTPAPKRAAVLPRRRPGCTHAALGPSPGGRRCGGARTQSRLLAGVPQRRIVSGERPRRKSPVNCARRAVRIVKESVRRRSTAHARGARARARARRQDPRVAQITPLSLTLLEVDRLARLGRTH
jgi:hypothetical protein